MIAQALVFLAETPRGMATSTEIADQLDLNPVVVRRLLGVLRSEGVVELRSGPKGGWAIARDPSKITLGSIHRLLARDPEVVSPAALDEVLLRAEEAYAKELDAVTLADVAGPPPN